MNFVLVFVLLSIFREITADAKETACPGNFKKVEARCLATFRREETWERAYNVCRNQNAYLLHLEGMNFDAVSKYAEEEKVDEIHLGIKWKIKNYLTQEGSPKVFNQTGFYAKERFGWKDERFVGGCLSFRFSTRELSDVSCTRHRSAFVCSRENETETPLLCDPGWTYSYLSGSCLKEVDVSGFSHHDCRGRFFYQESRDWPVSAREFDRSERNDSRARNETSDDCPENHSDDGTIGRKCSRKNGYFCQKEAKKIEIKAAIKPGHTVLASFGQYANLTFSMDVEVRIDGKKYDYRELTDVVWWKNDYPTLYGNTTYRLYYRVDRLPSVAIYYYYSFKLPGYPHTVFSDRAGISVSELSTYLLTLTIPSACSNESVQDEMRIIYKELVSNRNITSMIEKFHSEIKIGRNISWWLTDVAEKDDKIVVDIVFFFHLKDRGLINEKERILLPLQKFINNSVTEYIRKWKVDSFKLTFSGRCLAEERRFHDTNFTWNDTYYSLSAVSSPPCLTQKWELVTRKCRGGYAKESKWEDFDYSKCLRSNQFSANPPPRLCVPGYADWNVDLCLRQYREELNWSDAVEECGKDGGFLFSPRIDANNRVENFQFLFEQGRRKEVWLGGRRNAGPFQWMAFYPETINASGPAKFRWEEGQPVPGNDCLSGVIGQREILLYSRRCREKRPFWCMHKAFVGEQLPRNCPDGWKSLPWLRKCYRRTEIKMNRRRWREYCGKGGGRLATLALPEVNTLVKSYISERNGTDSGWWIGLRRSDEGFIWEEEDETVRYVDWAATTDFGPNYTAGLIKVEGSGVFWSLDDPEKNHFGICQSTVEDSRVSCEIVVVSEGVFKCLCSERYYKSVTWYKDGVIVNGTRGLTTGGDEYLTVRNLLSTNASLDRARLQGYYWCQVDQKRPFVSVASPQILFTYKNVWTFVGEFDSSMDFLPLDPSTAEYSIRCRNIGEKMEKALASVGRTAVHVNRLSETKGKIKVNFFVYTHSSSKKRDTKTDESKEKLLNELQNRMTRSSGLLAELKISPESIRIKSADGCFSTVTEMGDRNVTWPRKNFGEIALTVEDCVTDRGDAVVRRCLGNFTRGTYWGPVDGKCRGKLSDLTLRLKELSASDDVNVTKQLSILVNDWPRIRAIDIHYVATCLEKVSGKPNFSNPQESFREIASTINNLMKVDSSVLASASTKTNASSRITASLESLLENNNVFVNTSDENIIIASHPPTSENVEVGIFVPVDTNRVESLHRDTLLNDEYRVRIRLPSEVWKDGASSNAAFNYVVYKNDALFFTNRTDRAVVSNVLYARPAGGPVRLSAKRIEIAFRVFTVSRRIPHSPKCVFWDYSANRKMGDWSDLGCETKNRTAGRVVCRCDHATNFAVLVNLHPDYVEQEVHAVALDIFTYAGCALSIMGLVLTLSSFVMFEKLRKGVVSKVLCNLASAILLSLIVFVSGIDRISSEKGCIFVAALLHYSLMASFCWMLVEALQQYLKLVKVLNTYIPKFMLKASIFAWGTPLVVVVVIMSVDYRLYHGGKNYCWLQMGAFYYGFLLPVGIVMLVNSVIFCLVFYSVARTKKPKLKTDDKKLVLKRLRAAVCILTLLGLSWTFGFFAINGAKLVFKYLFTISVTLQGFVIFLFQVVCNKSVRDSWIKYLRRKRSAGLEDSVVFSVIRKNDRQKCP
ncbi:uncharacterized protein [Centruroides vittatus]|uniref:uncharacterized protein n=1 Tax=Centruroides vittatus TaxID=120091 RepID=UPI00350FF1EA